MEQEKAMPQPQPIMQAEGTFPPSVMEMCQPGQKSLNKRLSKLLITVAYSNDELAAWSCLRMFRELLCTLPVVEEEGNGRSQLDYIPLMLPFVGALNKQWFCAACSKVADLIYSGCTTYRGKRDVLLHILTTHKNLQTGREQEMFAECLQYWKRRMEIIRPSTDSTKK